MPETQALRSKILNHLEEHTIPQRHLAMLIDENPQYLSEVLNGKKNRSKSKCNVTDNS